MRIWLITVGEPLPLLSSGSRPWRTGLLASELTSRGHSVYWWTSRFDHFRKEYFRVDQEELPASERLTLGFLDGRPYRNNVSLARLRNHRQLARNFAAAQVSRERPDAIVCSFPTIELALQAVRLGVKERVPVVIDIRDLWPDIFLDVVPASLRWLGRLVLEPYYRATSEIMGSATSVVGISEGYLQWGLASASRTRRPADTVIPLAYDLPPGSRKSRADGRELLQRFGGAADATTCIFAGTFGRTYDVGPILAVAPDLQGGARPFQFVLCGDGERQAEWKARAAGLNNVIFTGWLDQDQLRLMLAASDVGLAAYAREAPQGIPNKIIEYLAAGLPVVSSLRGESARLLHDEDCGASYEPENKASLRDALLAVMDRRHAERSANASAVFDRRYRAEAVYGAYADHIEDLVSASRNRA